MSLTIGAIAGSVGSAISGIAEGALTIIKIIAAVGFATIFAAAIVALLGLVESFVVSGVVGEVLGIMGCCLPFNPALVFSSFALVATGITAFLVAKKIYELTSNLIGITS